MPLIRDYGIMKALENINGDFALTYTDGKRIIAARDPVGVRPLFYTRYAQNSIAFASEARHFSKLGDSYIPTWSYL
jgi:asparagine synthase (glutamine-hydrolysing)